MSIQRLACKDMSDKLKLILDLFLLINSSLNYGHGKAAAANICSLFSWNIVKSRSAYFPIWLRGCCTFYKAALFIGFALILPVHNQIRVVRANMASISYNIAEPWILLNIDYYRGGKTQNFPGSSFLRAKTFWTKCTKPFLTTLPNNA